MTATKEYIRPTMKVMDVQPMVLMNASDPTLGIDGTPTNGMSGDSQEHRGTFSNLWGIED